MKNVEAAARALEAYSGKELAGANPELVKEDLQDLITDLEHFAEAFGCAFPEYPAHQRYLQEAGRCFGCGMTAEEIQTEYKAEVANHGKDSDRVIPPDECTDVWDRLGQAGPHSWTEAPPRPGRTDFYDADGAPQDLGNETYATDGSALIEQARKGQ